MPFIMFVSSSFNTYVNLPKKKNDTIQARSNSDFDVKCATIHHSQSDRLIVLKVFMESPDMFSYIRLKF